MDSSSDRAIEMQGLKHRLKSEHYFRHYYHYKHDQNGVYKSIQVASNFCNKEGKRRCIQANSRNDLTDDWENKVVAIDLLDIKRVNNQDKCPNCGVVVFSRDRGDSKVALTCQQCHTNISACTRVLTNEHLF